MKIEHFVLGAIETNSYIFYDETKECAVVDGDAGGKDLIEFIEKNGLKPVYFLLTHGHHDHIGAIAALKEKYPEAQLCIGKNDVDLIDGSRRNNMLKDKAGNIIPPDVLVSDGDKVIIGNLEVEVVETPGHTKGGVCYLVDGNMFSGDTLFAGDCGRCDLYGGNWETMKKSLKKLAALPGDYKVYPGHGPFSTLEKERKDNQYMNA